jgi:hypothetical protein
MLQSGRMNQVLDQVIVILPDSSITWIQLPGQELDSSCLTGAWHEYNFLVMNLIHPVWLEHDMNTTSCSWTWLILHDWSMTWIQLPVHERMSQVLDQKVVFMSCLSQVGWIKFLTRKLYSCNAPVRQDESSSWPGNCIHAMLQSGRMNQVLDQVVVFM